MAKFIDADMLDAEILKYADRYHSQGEIIVASSILKVRALVREAPATDVEPVTRGKWILEREPDGTPYCFHCSNCDSDGSYIGVKAAYDYCPLCGAKMDEVG